MATLTDEKPRQNGPTSHYESHPPGEGIDVIRAEQEFNELSRQLSGRGEEFEGRWDEKSASTVHASGEGGRDIEKGEDKSDAFDLRDYLTSSNDANQEAGIKHKVCMITVFPRDRYSCRAPIACWRYLG